MPFFQQQWLNISPTANLQVRVKLDTFYPPGPTGGSGSLSTQYVIECGYRGPGASASDPEVSGKVTLRTMTSRSVIDPIVTPWVSLPGTITYIAARVTLNANFAGSGFTGLTLETRLGS